MSEHISDIVTRDDLAIFGEEEIRKLVAKFEIAEHFDPYRYLPPGPVAQAFILSTALTKVIMGPLGGGKTTTCAFARITAATLAPIARHPEDKKPTRMCRWIVLRDTFRSAEKTVLESWKQWFPKGYPGSTWTGGNDRPVTHTLRFIGKDGIRIEAITEFAGLGEASIETLMKGREYSGAWLNEIDTHAAGSLDDLEQRVGRYPKADILLTAAQLLDLAREMRLAQPLVSGQRQRFVIGDMNAPTIDNWTFKVLVKERKPDRAFFQQPSGRSVDAENRFNLEADYYDRIVRNQEEHFVKRMVDNEFGYSRSGKPVLASFSYFRHAAGHRLPYRPELDLYIGIDASTSGLSPAAIFAQSWTPRIAFVDELYLGHGVGPARFGEGLQKKIEHDYPDARIKVFVDPAAQFGADKEGGQLAALEVLAVILGVPILVPANGSNELGMRIDAINAELRGYLEPHSHLIVCPEKCPLWLEGASGKYRFRKKPEASSNEYDDTPEKLHPWSDLQDAGQYVVLGIRGRAGAIRGAARGDRPAGNGSRWGSQMGESGPTSPSRPRERGGFNPHRF